MAPSRCVLSGLQSATGEDTAARGAATAEARAGALAALRAANLKEKQRTAPDADGAEALTVEEQGAEGDEDAGGAVKENREPAVAPVLAARWLLVGPFCARSSPELHFTLYRNWGRKFISIVIDFLRRPTITFQPDVACGCNNRRDKLKISPRCV